MAELRDSVDATDLPARRDVEFAPGARRQFNALDPRARRCLLDRLTRLARDPSAPGGDVKKLTGPGNYRLRVGDCHVMYELATRTLTVTVVATSRRRAA